ncbi:sensor histidine kinase [Streptomyces sp. NPDC057197]|uniref:sensor histidine kinase n=1 Tax=Streptomyces sp. NPDC057197 TaxID=3346045 RepID=UPI00362C95BC
MRIHPRAVDGLTALVATAVAALLGAEAAARGWPPPDPAAWTLVALANLSLAVRGRAPLGVFLFVHLCWIAYVALGHWPVVGAPAAMVALYTVAATRSARTAAVCAVLLGGTWVCAGVAGGSGAFGARASLVGQGVGCPLVLWRFGQVARRAAELTVRLRAEQAERARREVAGERVRIARELHDVIAHHMAVITIQAGLARFVLDTDTRTARQALTTVGAAGGEALAELRRMLGLLRAEGAEGVGGTGGTCGLREGGPATEPAPGLDRLEELVERVRAGGVHVGVRIRGASRPLPPGVQLCVYRVVQEALTNVLKHAPGARADVELVYRTDELAVSVTDDGGNRARTAGTGGHGLIGMRERAKLYDGTIAVGPRREGGFGVHLTLPTPPPEQAARRGGAVTE